MSEDKTQVVTMTLEIEVECRANPHYFDVDIPKDIDEELMRNGPIPCEGSGSLGWWCDECRFGKILDWERFRRDSDGYIRQDESFSGGGKNVRRTRS